MGKIRRQHSSKTKLDAAPYRIKGNGDLYDWFKDFLNETDNFELPPYWLD